MHRGYQGPTPINRPLSCHAGPGRHQLLLPGNLPTYLPWSTYVSGFPFPLALTTSYLLPILVPPHPHPIPFYNILDIPHPLNSHRNRDGKKLDCCATTCKIPGSLSDATLPPDQECVPPPALVCRAPLIRAASSLLPNDRHIYRRYCSPLGHVAHEPPSPHRGRRRHDAAFAALAVRWPLELYRRAALCQLRQHRAQRRPPPPCRPSPTCSADITSCVPLASPRFPSLLVAPRLA